MNERLTITSIVVKGRNSRNTDWDGNTLYFAFRFNWPTSGQIILCSGMRAVRGAVLARGFAKVPYNKARRFDWRPLRESVFGPPEPFVPPERRAPSSRPSR